MAGPDPWDDPDNLDVREEKNEKEGGTRSKALCYEDVRIYLVRVEDKRSALATEARLAHHNETDNRSKA